MPLKPVLTSIGAILLAQAAWMVASPATFTSALADFGPRNDHLLRDGATIVAALGIALLVAARRPSWRVPVLFVGSLQSALHALNHLVDVDLARTALMGWFDVLSLAALAVLLGVLAGRARREEVLA